MLRLIVATLAIYLAMPALPVLAAWPAEVVAANHALDTATSFRIIRVDGTIETTVDVQRPDRERIELRGQVVVRVGDNVWMRTLGGPWKTLSTTGAGRIATLSEVDLPPNAVVIREADDTDGVSAAHLYHVIYPGGTPQLRWYIRVSDGLVHKIRGPGRAGPLTITIDRYNSVPAINAPR